MSQMRVDIARLGYRAKIIGHNCPFFTIHDHGQRTVFGVIAVHKRAVVAPRLRPYPAHGYASFTSSLYQSCCVWAIRLSRSASPMIVATGVSNTQ
jgi:hypothetical protein